MIASGWWAVGLLASAPAAPPTVFPPNDFVEYWSAARVHARGGDPYDGVQLLPLQREAAGDPGKTEATMLWTPPWTLPLYTPFGLLEPRAAHLAWLAAQVGCVLLSAWLLWRVYAPRAPTSWPGRAGWGTIPVLVAAAFAPVWWMVWYGQNTGFVLLGVAGFVYLRARGRPGRAGATAALTAIKPHLLALFGLALLLDAATRPGRRALLGGVAVLVLLAVLALVPDPDVFRDFAAALRRPRSAETVPLAQWQVPTPGYYLRKAVAGDRLAADAGALFWVQFVPLAAGVALLGPYWWARRRTWDWATEAPRLVFASVLVAPYGAWMFDLTVLLVPVVAVFARLARSPRLVPVTAAAGAFVLLSVATVIPPGRYRDWFGVQPYLHHYVWYAPAVLVWCGFVTHLARPAVNPPTEDHS
ncbi:MAG TPA: glycosyltransferase family 87 protein [Fimbriiglobus sp.]|nr:glycosyltransferase family 87 protein [Fimbriiglobus sp.]